MGNPSMLGLWHDNKQMQTNFRSRLKNPIAGSGNMLIYKLIQFTAGNENQKCDTG